MTADRRALSWATRLAMLALAASLLAACQAMPAPKFGPGPPNMMSKKGKTLGPAPVKGADVRFTFTALNGVPAEMGFALEDDLKKYAATRQLAIVPAGDKTAVYNVSGYLSAVGGDTGTLLVYVWDISNAGGTPLYRISGQESGNPSKGDPWEGITPNLIDNAARDTVDKLADWVRG
ncbi:MAG TPA: hypothetical protein VG894_08435 [Bauldia sp.]|nr:hypothetical protein [Bauldia sp.]